jgi:adenine-specific DNA-methyltransferase
MTAEEKPNSGAYRHPQQSVQRPDAGVEAQFSNRKAPRIYRYDSSLAPELVWDENGEREFAEWLLNLIAEAAEKGESAVFAEPLVWTGSGETFSSLAQCAARLKSLTKPFLNWAGKAERQQISVPTIPLFVHERHSTQAILEKLKSHKAAGTNLELFGDPEIDIADKLDAYQHQGPWTNRLILGDSLQVMNSLLEYEGLGGQVQMIYIDPPYGVKFGSNFQPFVRKRDVQHGKDEEMIREPEMVKAYRDTWELGLHSYLTYLRDRLLLAKELLTESGSVFVQISDENLHHVREVMDEVLGERNFVALIAFSKTTGFSGQTLSSVADFILWYAKDIDRVKFHQIYRFKEAGDEGASKYRPIETFKSVPDGIFSPQRLATSDQLTSQGAAGKNVEQAFEFKGKVYRPPQGLHWKTTVEGLRQLAKANRIIIEGNSIRYIRFLDDFPVFPIANIWTDIGGIQNRSEGKLYVVQTAPLAIQRCMLMTTDPGDLVFDPTCGSGTTAYVAEQWGRRWFTCDTSRVPLALARQRLLTATFPWYELKESAKGPAGGFIYKRNQNRKGEEIGGKVPRITLKSIANNEEPEMVTLVDRPEVNTQVTRVCGPFTVEATIQAAMSLNEEDNKVAETPGAYADPRAFLDRMIEVLRQSKTLRLPGNLTLQLESVRHLADCESLHAEATARNGDDRRIGIAFGPEDGAIGSEFVFNAASEARYLKYDHLFLFGFAIQAKAREMAEDRGKLRIPCTYVAMTPDLVMSDLLKTSKASEIFSITGLPEVVVKPAGKRPDGTLLTLLYQVEIKGLDIFRPDTLETESIDAENLPCWMLDTDYNGMVFCASQVFFPKTSAWDNLQKSLKGQFNESVWEHLAGTVSEPFVAGNHRRIAIKVIDERGNELMVVKSLGGGE